MLYGISTTVWLHGDLESALRRIAAAGFKQIEIMAEPPHMSPDTCDTKRVAGWLKELDLHAPVAHGRYSFDKPDLGALDEARRLASVAHVAGGFDQLIALGVQYVVLHPTGSAKEYTAAARDARLDQACKSMDELAEIIRDTPLKIAWENLPHYHQSRPLHDMAELRQLVDQQPANVGLCVDTTHALISEHDPIEQIKIAGDRLFCLHLHDSDGVGDCHWVPGKGIIDWPRLRQCLDDMKFTGPRTLEPVSTPDTVDAVLADAFRVVQEWSR